MLTLIDNRFASVPSLRVNVPFLFTASNEDIERVEVLLGPAAALYGPNSANGVLHIITKSPFTSEGTTLTVDGGERSVFRIGGRHARALSEAVAFKLTGEYMQGQDWKFFDPAEPKVFPNTPNTPRARVGQPNVRDFNIERYGGEARLDWRINQNAEWINTYGLANGGNTVELTGANGAGQVRDWMIQSFQSRLRAGRLFAQVFANLSDAGNKDSTDLNGTYLLRTGQPIVDKSRVIGGQVQYASDFGTMHSLVYGLDYTFTNPVTGGTINGRNEDDDNTSEIGGYAQSTTRLSPEVGRAARRAPGPAQPTRRNVLLAARGARLQARRSTELQAHVQSCVQHAGELLLLPRPASGRQHQRAAVQRSCCWCEGRFPFQARLQWRRWFTVHALSVHTGGRWRTDHLRSRECGGLLSGRAASGIAGGLRNSLLASGLPAAAVDATIARLGTFNAATANVGTKLTYITSGTSVAPEAVVDIEKLKPSYTNMLELGYKGTIGSRLFLAVDGWYQRRENFTTAAQNFTPNALLDGPTLGAGLAAHLTPVLGAAWCCTGRDRSCRQSCSHSARHRRSGQPSDDERRHRVHVQVHRQEYRPPRRRCRLRPRAREQFLGERYVLVGE